MDRYEHGCLQNLHCGLIGYQPSNAKTNKARNVPGNSSGPPPPVPPTTPYEALRQNVVNPTAFPGSVTAGVANTSLSQVASPSNSSSQYLHMNGGADNVTYVHSDQNIEIKPAALKPGVENQTPLPNSSTLNLTNDAKPNLSRIPPYRGMPMNASTSEDAPSGGINLSISVPLARSANAPASAPSTPPQQYSDVEDIPSKKFRCQSDGQMARTREDIHSAQENGKGDNTMRTEDSDSSPVVSNSEREHQSSDCLSAMSDGCPSNMPKMKRKIPERQSSESESSKRRALGAINAFANGDHSNVQGALKTKDNLCQPSSLLAYAKPPGQYVQPVVALKPISGIV
eukprot:Gb_41839 [translate_table: standard]